MYLYVLYVLYVLYILHIEHVLSALIMWKQQLRCGNGHCDIRGKRDGLHVDVVGLGADPRGGLGREHVQSVPA